MTRLLCVFHLLFVLGLPWAAAQEVPAPERLSLADAVRMAEENNAGLAAARRQAAIEGADVIAARRRPNPVFEAASEGYGPGRPGGFGDGHELTLQLSQELETGGRRGSRIDFALAGQAAAGAELVDAVRQLRRRVGRAYFALAGARTEAETSAAALAEIDQVLEVNRAKYAQGEISGGELRRLEVERLRFEGDSLTAELTTRQATTELRALLGSVRLDIPIQLSEGLTVPEGERGMPPAPDLVQLALARRPDMAALRHQQDQAQADVTLQRALRAPAPTIAAGYKRDFGQNGIVMGVSIPLPLFDSNAGGVARADAVLLLAEARLREAETVVAVEVRNAADLVDISRRRVELLERDYIGRARQARDAAAAAYKAGEAELIDFLDAQRAYRDVRRAETRALLDLRVSLFELRTTIGAAPGEPLQ